MNHKLKSAVTQGRNSVVNFGGDGRYSPLAAKNFFYTFFHILNFGGGLLSIV